MPDELGRLCLACGLCCDGSLFRGAGLLAEEVEPARKRGLAIIDEGKGFAQPCPKLEHAEDEKRCSMYADRPKACRGFTCKLYVRHRDEGGALEPRLAVVARTRQLLAILEADGLSPRGAGERSLEFQSPETMEAFVELMETIGDHFKRAD